MRWALEEPPNPRVVLVHTTIELTARTIETCPPWPAAPPLEGLLAVAGVRSLDLHRYRARVNLRPGVRRPELRRPVLDAIVPLWGEPSELPPPEPPRAFRLEPRDPASAAAIQRADQRSGRRARVRLVAESLEMAGQHPVLRALFVVPGVAEAVVEEPSPDSRAVPEPTDVTVRLARLFRWSDHEELVIAALTETGG